MRVKSTLKHVIIVFVLISSCSPINLHPIFAANSTQNINLVVKPNFGGPGYYAFYPQVIVVQQNIYVNITVRNLSDKTFHLIIGQFANATIKSGVNNGTSISPVDTNLAIFSPSNAGIFIFKTIERSELIGQFVVLPSNWSGYDPPSELRNYTQIIKPDYAGDMYDEFISGVLVANLGDNVSITIRNTDDADHGFALTSYGIDEGIPSGTDLKNGTIAPYDYKIDTFTASTPGIFWFECTVYCGEGHIFMAGTLVVLPKGGVEYNPEPVTAYRYLTLKSGYAGNGYDKFMPEVIFLNQNDLAYILIRNTSTKEYRLELPSFNIHNATILSANTTTLVPSDTFITPFAASRPGINEFYGTVNSGSSQEINGYLIILPRLTGSPHPTPSPTISPTSTPGPTPSSTPSPSEVQIGESYFEGSIELQNGGPPCNSCHTINVLNLTGTSVGPDLSYALNYTKQPEGYSGPYIDFNGNATKLNGFLHSPTTSVMKSTWENNPLASQEIDALSSLIQYAYQKSLTSPTPTPTSSPTPTPSPSPTSPYSLRFSFITFLFVSAGMMLAGVIVGLVILSGYVRKDLEEKE